MFFQFSQNFISKWQVGFQIPASPIMEGIVNFHHDLFFFLTAISFFIIYMLIRTLVLFNSKTQQKPIIVVRAPFLEIVWTLIPAIILIFVAIPSFSLLYSMDDLIDPFFTIKVIGHQWYWSYEFLDPNVLFKMYFFEGNLEMISNVNKSELISEDEFEAMWRSCFPYETEKFKKLQDGFNYEQVYNSFANKDEKIREMQQVFKTLTDEFINEINLNQENLTQQQLPFSPIQLSSKFDSFLLADEFLEDKSLRLLEVDNKLYLPVEMNIRILVTAADVLHSWAVPALGVKIDGCPGRLNQTSVFIKRPGTFYGQCSEICGVNHGFMPIAVVGLDILGDGSGFTEEIAETILPIYTILLGKLYDKS